MFPFPSQQNLEMLNPPRNPYNLIPISPSSLDFDGLNHLILPCMTPNISTNNNHDKSSSTKNTSNNISKRSARKDRHSKICTASGLRDRRMRLSLDVAQKFFHLQDILGFDKPSKTVQWLLTKSKLAIKEVIADSSQKLRAFDHVGSPKNKTLNSECEDGYTIFDQMKTMKCKVQDRPSTIKSRKTTKFHPVLTKETRAKARERARERTSEKKRLSNLFTSSSSSSSSSLKFDTFIEKDLDYLNTSNKSLDIVPESEVLRFLSSRSCVFDQIQINDVCQNDGGSEVDEVTDFTEHWIDIDRSFCEDLPLEYRPLQIASNKFTV